MGGLELFGLFVILRWLFTGRGGPSPFAPSGGGTAPGQGGRPMPPPGDITPVVWPSTPPATLPPFPSGWEYDEPPPAEVQSRAQTLLSVLWAKGAGSRRVELVGGRWITFVAEVVRGGSRGVTAWRVKPSAARGPVAPWPQAPPTSTYAPSSPAAPAPATPGTSPAAVPASYTPPGAPASQSIANVQTALNQLGWQPPLVVDGKNGPLTQGAVRAFQRAHPPLAIDGVPGPQTNAAIAAALVSSPTPATVPATYTTPAAPTAAALLATTADVQGALNHLGWQPALVVDGKTGPKTIAAVQAFQRAHPPLAVDGNAGPQTKAAIATALASSPA